jgi:hypothetical protein
MLFSMHVYWLYVDTFILHVSFAIKNFVILVQDCDGRVLIYAICYDSRCFVPTATLSQAQRLLR